MSTTTKMIIKNMVEGLIEHGYSDELAILAVAIDEHVTTDDVRAVLADVDVPSFR